MVKKEIVISVGEQKGVNNMKNTFLDDFMSAQKKA